jgi:tRNA(Ile)-lysidine synthase
MQINYEKLTKKQEKNNGVSSAINMLLSQKVLHSLKQLKIKKGCTVLIGVSGGVDSMVLLHVLHAIRHALSVRICVAHFNHRLRKTSLRDQKAVVAIAKDLNIPIILGKRTIKLTSKKVSEDQARAWRFAFFADAMKRTQADILMLAHNQNDLAETLLMRLLRGTGLHGLRSILKTSDMDGIRIIRPLLDFSRMEIDLYAKKNSIHFCHDETNDSNLYLRNRIRKTLIPMLAKDYNPLVVNSLAQLAKSAGDDYDFLQAMANKRLKENIVISKRSVKMKISFLNDQHAAMVRLGLRHVFEILNGDLNQLNFNHVRLVSDLKDSIDGAVVHWPSGVKVTKSKHYLEFTQ